MANLYKKITKEIGLPPGTLVHVGEEKLSKSRIFVYDYDAFHYQEREIKTIEECLSFKDKTNVTWIRIQGLEDIEIFQKMDTHMGIHSLVLEDILNTTQRPKMEDFDEYVFIVLKVIYYNPKSGEMTANQASIILGQNYVISFEEREEAAFTTIRDRIKNDKGRIRKMGPDYLAYCLIDTIVDQYFVVLEQLGSTIERLEEDLMMDLQKDLSHDVHYLKREVIFLRKLVWPLREVISGLQRGDSRLVKKMTTLFLRDLYDHTIQVIDTVESYRDILSGVHEIDLSNTNKKLNEIMKVLTSMATIFIPITFIASLYGMNFKFMPELDWKWGYHVTVGLMAFISFGMFLHFKRKKWL